VHTLRHRVGLEDELGAGLGAISAQSSSSPNAPGAPRANGASTRMIGSSPFSRWSL
jgi:hypothetical protein